MIYTVRDFCNCIKRGDFGRLVENIKQECARPIDANICDSYTQASVMLTKAMEQNRSIGDCHIAIDTSMLLEYKLPSASAWCDVVLLGRNNEDRYQVLILELKNWRANTSDKPGIAEGLIEHNNEQCSHPSDQVRGYTEYCQRFHSTVQEYNADCCGAVFFTQAIDLAPYALPPNSRLVENYPNFNTNSIEDLANFVATKVQRSDSLFAGKFVNGIYKQDRNILRQVAEMFKSKGNDAKSPFVLIGPQREGFAKVSKYLDDTANTGEKQVIVVEGPPGSGKSAVAINLWAHAALKYTENNAGNCVFVTTSVAQDTNWRKIFKDTFASQAQGLIQKSTAYHAGLSPQTFRTIEPVMKSDPEAQEFFDKKGKLIPEKYRQITDYLIRNNLSGDYRDNAHLLSVVDEAHALINPFSPDFIGNYQAWPKWMGAQAYHIIRKSKVSVFFTDVEQSFREYESTSVGDIEKFAKELGASFRKVSLSDMQFRCAGSVDYVEWVERLFSDTPLRNHSIWKNQYKVNIVSYPSDVETFLRSRIDCGDRSVRLLSSYTKKWVSNGKIKAKHRDGIECDFDIPDKDGKRFRKYWNSEYDAFVQNSLGSTMAEDPLSEVGCPYVVRGFDYSWVGLLWLKDLLYRRELGGWCIPFKYLEETAIKTIKSGAKKEWSKLPSHIKEKYTFEGDALFSASMKECPMITRLFKAQKQAYRILMTRAMKGLCIYIEDPETREYIRGLLQ